MKKQTLFYWLMAALVAGIVALDQWTKWLTVRFLPLGTTRRAVDGVFYLTHVQNDGGAWGLFSGKLWLFVLVLVVFAALLAFLLYKKWIRKKFELVCLAAILGGGIGNLIDRLAHGVVTDMIAFDFIDFPVFNVADCFITLGCLSLMVYVLFFDRAKPKDKAQPQA